VSSLIPQGWHRQEADASQGMEGGAGLCNRERLSERVGRPCTGRRLTLWEGVAIRLGSGLMCGLPPGSLRGRA
jgi:hypothetical protein